MILETWGEIAARLHVSVATAKRWHAKHGLPVRKRGRHKQARIETVIAELDAWRARFVRPAA